ncbi:MAG: hypothetical protein PHP08_05040 [Candidatus Dojkabacteria bacterium]|nr:hypothetical protein [Candidatus Dojkabacteria bacterium]
MKKSKKMEDIFLSTYNLPFMPYGSRASGKQDFYARLMGIYKDNIVGSFVNVINPFVYIKIINILILRIYNNEN